MGFGIWLAFFKVQYIYIYILTKAGHEALPHPLSASSLVSHRGGGTLALQAEGQHGQQRFSGDLPVQTTHDDCSRGRIRVFKAQPGTLGAHHVDGFAAAA